MAELQEVHVNDIGTKFAFTYRDGANIVNISTASVQQAFLTPPSGTVKERTTVFTTPPADGSTGKAEYLSIAGDFDENGIWEVQGRVVLANGTWSSNTCRFRVHGNLHAL